MARGVLELAGEVRAQAGVIEVVRRIDVAAVLVVTGDASLSSSLTFLLSTALRYFCAEHEMILRLSSLSATSVFGM